MFDILTWASPGSDHNEHMLITARHVRIVYVVCVCDCPLLAMMIDLNEMIEVI